MISQPVIVVVAAAAAGIVQLLAEKGVQFHFQTTAKEFVGENGQLKQVVLRDGTVLLAELCVIGIGESYFKFVLLVYPLLFVTFSQTSLLHLKRL